MEQLCQKGKKTDQKTGHQAHVLASTEQACKFSDGINPTPSHKNELINMPVKELRQIGKRNNRDEDYKLIESRLGSETLKFAKEYDEILRTEAKLIISIKELAEYYSPDKEDIKKRLGRLSKTALDKLRGRVEQIEKRRIIDNADLEQVLCTWIPLRLFADCEGVAPTNIDTRVRTKDITSLVKVGDYKLFHPVRASLEYIEYKSTDQKGRNSFRRRRYPRACTGHSKQFKQSLT